MKVFFLGNGDLAVDALHHLVARGDEVVGIALHPAEHARRRDDLLAACALPPERVFDGSRLDDPEHVEAIRTLAADAVLSVLFGYVLRPALLAAFPRGAVNLHPSYLPWNRGAHPNAWSLAEGTPAGVTLHLMEAEVDRGPILARRRVEVEPVDTAASLYTKLMAAGAELLVETWGPWAEGRITPRAQETDAGSSHRVADLDRLDRIELDAPTTARALLAQLRARTFPPHPGAWFRSDDGRRVEVRVELAYLDEEDPA